LLPNTNGSGACAVPTAPRLRFRDHERIARKYLRNVIPSGMQGFGRRTFAHLGLIADASDGLPSLSLMVKSGTAGWASTHFAEPSSLPRVGGVPEHASVSPECARPFACGR